MAIRPVDLQLAYMAAPQNAAVLSNAQEAPQTAQQAAAAAFADEVTRRQEHVDQSGRAVGTKVRPRQERDPAQGDASDQQRRRRQSPSEDNPERGVAPERGPLGLTGDGEHFIDVTA